MKKLQFLGLLLIRLISRYHLLILIILAALVGGLFFLKYKMTWQQTPILSEGIIGVYMPDSLPKTVGNLLSHSLVQLDNSGTPQPDLASSWEVNDNSTVYTFHLKDNLFWNDGTKLVASDLKFNLSDVEVSYIDDKTIQFKLPDSFSVFPSLLTVPVFKNGSLTGTGDYKVSYQEINRGLLSRLQLTPTKSGLPNLNIRFYPDDTTATTAFNLGEINSIIGLSEIGSFLNIPEVQVKKITNYNKIVTIFYNTKDPILSDKNFRRALGYAAPQVKDLVRAKTSISPLSWAYDDSTRDYLNNPTEAKNWLDKVTNGKDSTITLTATSALSSVGDQVISAWHSAGINAVLRVESGLPQNFQALLITQDISSDPDQYSLWHSTQNNLNLSKYKSDRVDKDLEDGRKISDIKVRKDKYFDFQKYLMDDSPATFLYFPTFNIVYRSKVESLLNQILPLEVSNSSQLY